MLLLFLTDTLKFYRQHFIFLMSIVLPIAIPLELIQTSLFLNLDPAATNMNGAYFMLAVNLVIYPFYQAPLVIGVQQLLNGQRNKPSTLIKQGLPFWFAILTVNLAFFVAIVSGLMLLIIPGIFIAVRLSLAEQNVILDGESAMDALKSSFSESGDAFWFIFFGMMTLIGASYLVSWPISNWFENTMPNSAVSYFIPAVIGIVLYPLLVIYLLRVRHYLKHNE